MPRRITAFFSRFVFFVITAAPACSAQDQYDPNKEVCDLLSRSEIEMATGLRVSEARPGVPSIALASGTCTWQGTDGARVILVLGISDRMRVTMDSMLQAGGEEWSGVGTSAVGTRGFDSTGFGYNLSLLDAKGGVAITIPGDAGTSGRTLALARVLEIHR
jgi:hypothetical protein